MSFFYQNGHLKVGSPQASKDVEAISRLADGPVYIYDLSSILTRYKALQNGLLAAFKARETTTKIKKSLRLSIHYALKANSHPEILRRLAQQGSGADTVSAGEIRLALAAGIPTSRIIFSGVGKTKNEIRFAIASGIKQINVESPQELRRISEIAAELDRTVDVAFRMNPDVNPKTHPYITTGFRENKFGMDESFLPELLEILKWAQPRVRLCGLTLHIGSQLLELHALREGIEKTIALFQQIRAIPGVGHSLDRLDIGGGLGLNYETDDEATEFQLIQDYGKMVAECLGDIDVELMLEPGRILVGRAGLLVSEVQYIKRAPAKTFIVLDTGMHHLLRPALYGAKHRVLSIKEASQAARSPNKAATTEAGYQNYDIVGPICESSDVIARDVCLGPIEQGDLLGIADTGAYGFTMASHYNAHELPRQVVVE